LALGLCVTPSRISGSNHSRLDSLQKVLVKTTDIEKKVQIYLSLAELVKPTSTDSCKFFLGEAKKRFCKINSFPYIGRAYETGGDISRVENNFNEAIRQYRISALSYQKQGEQKKQIKLLNQIGSIYAQTNNISESFSYYLKVREIAEEVKDSDMMAKVNNNLGRIYVATNNYTVGIDYYNKALAVFENGSDSFKIATVFMNLGAVYNHMEKADSAREYLKKAITIFRAINNQPGLGTCLGLYSYSLLPGKRYTEALNYLNEALTIAENRVSGQNMNDSRLMRNDILYLMGLTNYEMGNYKRARKYFYSCSHLSDTLKHLERSSEVAEYLSKSYEETGQVDSAYYFYRLFKLRSDSLLTIKSINVVKLTEAQLSYEKKIKEKKMQLEYSNSLRKHNLIIFIGIGAILLTLVLILYQRLRIEKQKKKQIEVEKRQAELEKQTADIQIESQNRELTLNVMNFIRKSELIVDLSNRLIQIKESMDDEKAGSEITQLVNTMQKSSEGNVWEEFELRFKQVHNNFYVRLLEKFPDLTPSELKLCALLKLNLSNKEISEMSGQRSATLEVARYRLRKKLGISNTQVNLVSFLSQL
jgi:tetratricopeptide (TPR) repeat protein/DNA-binding CsgD family transcriptional regulator